MKKLILFVLVFITLQSNVIAETAAAIGDSIHAIHYTINIDEINTSDKTINGWAEVIITPKINQIQQIKLDLKDLTVDSVFIN